MDKTLLAVLALLGAFAVWYMQICLSRRKRPKHTLPTITLRLSGVPTGIDKDDLYCAIVGPVRLSSVRDVMRRLSWYQDGEIVGMSLAPAVDARQIQVQDVATVCLTKLPTHLETQVRHKGDVLFKRISLRFKDGYRQLFADSEFSDLTPLYDSPNAAFDIVAVTGWAGHPFRSWKPKDSSEMWLRDWLGQDLAQVSCPPRVFTYGYPSKVAGSSSDADFHEYARGLIRSLKIARNSTEKSRRPLIFIGHSLGGIIVKQALKDCFLSNDPQEQCISLACICLVMFGVPSQGLDIRAMLAMTEGQRNDQFARDLGPESNYLPELHRNFCRLVSQRTIRTITVYERYDSPSVEHKNGKWSRTGPPVRMVTRESAVNYGPSNTAEDENAIPSMTNHSDLAKFRERGTGTYVEILQKIVETMTDRSRNKLGKTMSTVQGTVVQNNDTRILGARPPLEDPFGDRSEALGAIQGGFSDSLKSSVFVLHGIGGVGKTQIALKYIAERAGSFNKILWVQADCEERLEESLRTIANEMLLTSENNRDDLELIISKLVNSTNRFLIVFDNIDERALLKTIVEILQPRQAKNLCVLITTRDKESMSLATKSYEVRPFEKNQGSRLLLELVGNAQVCSTTTASQICNELGNLPLAIKQMAAYITIAGMPSGSIAEQVRSEPRLAMVFTPELWPYRKSVMTVWEPSLGRIRTLNPYAERWLLLCSFLGREVPHEIYIHAFNQFSIRPYAHLAWLFESTGHWSPNIMLHNIQELHKASLITTVEHMKRRFSFMHPLVQHWAPTRLPTQEKIKYIEQSSWMLHACAEDLCRGDDPESIRAYLKQRWLFPFVSACVDFTRHDLRRNLGELITTESAVTFAILYIQEQKPEIAQDIMMEAAIKRADGNGETTLRPRRILCWALRRQKSCDVAAAVQESVVAQMELADMPPQHLLEARKELVAIYRDGRQWNKAMTLSIKVEEDAYNIFGREALETLRVMSCIATVRCQIDLEEGLLIEKYVVETYRKKYPGKEEFANKLRNLAITYYELGRFEDAEKLEIEVLELKACLFGPDHYETASAKHNLAATLTKLQKYPRVEELFQSALDIRYRALGERNQRTIKTAAKLAKTLLAMGEGAKAQKIREQYHIATSA